MFKAFDAQGFQKVRVENVRKRMNAFVSVGIHARDSLGVF